MIDTKELRKLVQAATPGPWFSDARGNIWRRSPSDLYENGGSVAGDKPIAFVVAGWAGEGVTGYPAEDNANLIAAANPVAISELLDRLEAADRAWKESDKSCWDLTEKVIPNIREQLESAEKERDALRAKVEQMEKQEPHSYIYRYWDPLDGSPVWRHEPGDWNGQQPGACAPLYALPGAQAQPATNDEYVGWYCTHCERGVDASEVTYHEQHEVCGRVITNDRPPKPAPSVPTGWPTEEMTSAFAEVFNVRDQKNTFGPAFRAALKAAPEDKP